MTPLKILQICSAREIGGGERHVVDLSRGLVARGHEVHVAGIPGSPLIEELSFLPAGRISRVRMRNAFDIASAHRLAGVVRRSGLDIIHAHVARDYPLAAIASKLSGTPFVISRHVVFPMKGFHRHLLKGVSKVIAPSASVAASLRQQGLFDKSKIVSIPYGIDIDHYAQRPARVNSSDRRLVGMIGHLSPIKGQDVFIRAAASIAAEHENVDFLVVGEDKEQDGRNRAEIEKLVADLGLADRINLTGWKDDVRDVLEMLDIFVCPSRIEPFGLVMVEAMAAGVPVVATQSEGALEIIEDGATGRLVPIGDTIALAWTISGLLASEGERRSLTENALHSVRERFSLERMITHTERIYRDILTPQL
jgi:glycosyltransferase involved in cell wall biosynthesis